MTEDPTLMQNPPHSGLRNPVSVMISFLTTVAVAV